MSNLAEERHYEVVKANALIQKTRFSLSVQEQKVVLYLISRIIPEDDNFKLYEFDIKEFCRICGIDGDNGKNYADLKKAIKSLADKSIWITLENGRETLLRWIEKPYIEPKSGTVRIRLDSDMKPFLLQLKERFTHYTLYYVLAMRSKYSIRLYELLKSHEYRKRCEFSIDEFKKIMGAENYKQHVELKRYVLEIALREINEFGDIFVVYELEKTGRKFTKIRFIIKPKTEIRERLDAWIKIEERITPKQVSGQMNLFMPEYARTAETKGAAQ